MTSTLRFYRIALGVVALANLPLWAHSPGVGFELCRGPKIQSFRAYVGDSGSGPFLGFPDSFEGIGLEMVQARELSKTDVRLLFPIRSMWFGDIQKLAFVAEINPHISFGSITGTGLGARAYAGIRVRNFSLGAFSTFTYGRKNPWNNSRNTSESGLSLRISFGYAP